MSVLRPPIIEADGIFIPPRRSVVLRCIQDARPDLVPEPRAGAAPPLKIRYVGEILCDRCARKIASVAPAGPPGPLSPPPAERETNAAITAFVMAFSPTGE